MITENNRTEKLTITNSGKRLIAAIALLGAGLIIGHNVLSEPQFSEESHTITVGVGGTIWGVTSTVRGHELVNVQDIVKEIKKRSTEAFKDGQLNPGEKLIVPNSVG